MGSGRGPEKCRKSRTEGLRGCPGWFQSEGFGDFKRGLGESRGKRTFRGWLGGGPRVQGSERGPGRGVRRLVPAYKRLPGGGSVGGGSGWIQFREWGVSRGV